MNKMGSSDRAMAPTTILVLKRAPSCSLLRSAQRRSTVRVRIRRKTSRAAVIKVETVYRAMASRQLLGSKGTSSEPNVNTAESSSVRSAAPIPNVQRCFGSSELIEKPESHAAERSACAAILLACANDQGVKFIIQRRIARETAFKELANLFVTLSRHRELMSLEQSASVRIHHKNRVLTRV